MLAGEGADFARIIADKTSRRGVDVILDLVGAGYFAQNLESLAFKRPPDAGRSNVGHES